MTNLERLSIQQWQHDRSKTSMRPDYVVKMKFKDDTANSLTKAIITYLNLNGAQAERISNSGRVIDGRKLVTNSLGQTGLIGSSKWIPGTGRNGTSDVSATIKGRSVKIEIKMKDKQSLAQI